MTLEPKWKTTLAQHAKDADFANLCEKLVNREILTRCEGMRLVRKIVEEAVTKSGPWKVITDDANKGAADQGSISSTSARLLVSHAHEQINVLHRLISSFKLINALLKEGWYFISHKIFIKPFASLFSQRRLLGLTGESEHFSASPQTKN